MRFVVVAVTLVAALAGCAAPDEETARAPSPIPTQSQVPSATPTREPTPSPTPSPTATQPGAGTYLALGDSLAVGVGATRPDETGYVAGLYRALAVSDASPRVTALQNLAVSGETSTSMIRDGQLAAALDVIGSADPPIAVVTLDIGGNDLLRLLGNEACAADPQGPDCLQLLALTLEDFEANYRQIIGELTAALEDRAPGAILATMTYFNPFSGTDAAYEAAAELALLGGDGRVDCDAEEAQSRGMNDIIACVGEELGAIAVDVHPRFAGAGLELTHIGSEDIHANDRGYEVIAEAFRQALVGG